MIGLEGLKCMPFVCLKSGPRHGHLAKAIAPEMPPANHSSIIMKSDFGSVCKRTLGKFFESFESSNVRPRFSLAAKVFFIRCYGGKVQET